MAKSNMKETLSCDIKQVWDTVTNLKEYSWRSDLSRIDILNHNQFVEYAQNGYATTFTVTLSRQYERWEFDMENSNMSGHWIGNFRKSGDKTIIDFTEEVSVKNFFMKPFAGKYLQKQQLQYLMDLKKKLGC